jgi:hypothetical protein
MKKTIFSLTIFVIISCTSVFVQKTFIGNWKEKELEFSESLSFSENNNQFETILSNKFCCIGGNEYQEKQFKWLRKPNNLWSFFNILKSCGLDSFLSKEQYNKKLDEDDYWGEDWKGLSLNQVVDSLIKTFNFSHDSSDYYTSFWERRRIEMNDSIVLTILNETDSFFEVGKIKTDQESLNSELYELIKMNVELNETNDSSIKAEKTIEYFKFLKSLGLEHSAYNLIFETYLNKYVVDLQDSLLFTLSFDTISEEQYWLTRNNANWIKTYLDNGP